MEEIFKTLNERPGTCEKLQKRASSLEAFPRAFITEVFVCYAFTQTPGRSSGSSESTSM